MKTAIAPAVWEVDQSGFDELAAGLFWKPHERIAMLWGYFDESGEHGGGKLLRLTIGGVIAPMAVWQAFDHAWGKALEEQGLRYYHHRERGDPAGAFLKVIGQYLGAANHASVVSFTATARDGTADAYEVGFVDCLLQAANISARVEEISLTFARHPEFASSHGEGYRSLLNWGDVRLADIAFSDPKRVRPLQAADLVAHTLRTEDGVSALRSVGCGVSRYLNGWPQA